MYGDWVAPQSHAKLFCVCSYNEIIVEWDLTPLLSPLDCKSGSAKWKETKRWIAELLLKQIERKEILFFFCFVF